MSWSAFSEDTAICFGCRSPITANQYRVYDLYEETKETEHFHQICYTCHMCRIKFGKHIHRKPHTLVCVNCDKNFINGLLVRKKEKQDKLKMICKANEEWESPTK